MGHGNEGRHFVAVPLSVIRMDERFDGVADQLLWTPARQLVSSAGELANQMGTPLGSASNSAAAAFSAISR